MRNIITPTGSFLPEIILCSHLESAYRDELEKLFFFNPRQSRVREQVLKKVARYGPPEISDDGKSLTIALRNVQNAQVLFFLHGKEKIRLLGTVVYVIEKTHLKVSYLALDPSLTTAWQDSCGLLIFIIDTLRKIAGRIKGVEHIELDVGPRVVRIKAY